MTDAVLVKRLRDAGQAGREIITDWDHNPFLFLDAAARIEALEAALRPSAETKAAYIGEFSHRVTSISDDGEEQYFDATVPWTTIKEIMAAIRARAALEEKVTP